MFTCAMIHRQRRCTTYRLSIKRAAADGLEISNLHKKVRKINNINAKCKSNVKVAFEILKCTTEYSRLVGTKQYSRVPYDSAAADER